MVGIPSAVRLLEVDHVPQLGLGRGHAQRGDAGIPSAQAIVGTVAEVLGGVEELVPVGVPAHGRGPQDVQVVAAAEEPGLIAVDQDVLGDRLLARGVQYLQRQVVLLIVDQLELASELLGAVAEKAPDGPAVGVQHFHLGDARVRADHEPQPDPLRAAGMPPIALHLRVHGLPGGDDRSLADVLAGLQSGP